MKFRTEGDDMTPEELEQMQRVLSHMKSIWTVTPDMEAMFYHAYSRGFSDGWWSNQRMECTDDEMMNERVR